MGNKLSAKHTICAGCIAYVVQAIVNNFAPLLFVNFSKEYEFSLTALGFLVFLNFGIQLIIDFFSPKVIDRIGYRGSIIFGHVFAIIGLAGLSVLPEILPNAYLGVVISILFYAVGGGIIEVIVSPMIEACPTENKAGVMSFLHSFYCWGQAFVIIVSTVFFALFGIENWHTLSVCWAILPALNAIYLFFVPIDADTESEDKSGYKDLISNGIFWVLFVLMFCSGASEQSMSQWASTFAESALNVNKTVGDICGPCLFAIFMGASRTFYAKFSEKIKLQRFMIYSCFLGVFAYLLAILSGNPVISLVGCVLVGASVGVLWPGTFSLAASKLPSGGTLMYALLALAGDLGCSSGPAIVGIVAGWFNENLKKGLFIALIFPIAMIITIMKVNKKLANKILKDKKTWIGVCSAALIVVLSSFASGCGDNKSITTPTPTPTKIVVETPVPLITATPTTAVVATATPTPTSTPTLAATATPTPTRKPTATPTPESVTEFEGITITPRTGTVFATDSINIRRGPGTTYKVVGGGKVNEEFKVTGETSNGWWQISYTGGTAYISKEYSAVKGTMPTVQVTATPVPTKAPATATPTPNPTATPVPTEAAKPDFDSYVNFTGTSYIAVDAKTGEVLHAYKENTQVSPASLTKMMTAIIAVEQYYITDTCPTTLETLRWNDIDYNGVTYEGIDNEMTTFANRVKNATGKTYSFEDWQTASYTVEERLYQMLVYSSADAAEALAYMLEENLDYFAEEIMAQKAEELGLKGTHFTNAVGADATSGDEFAGNVSTASDLAKIAIEFMKDGTLRKIVKSKTYTVQANGNIPEVILYNSNLLVTDSTYANDNYTSIGIKTGHTDLAGYCLASCGQSLDGREVIVITLGNDSRAESAEENSRILDYIFTYEN